MTRDVFCDSGQYAACDISQRGPFLRMCDRSLVRMCHYDVVFYALVSLTLGLERIVLCLSLPSSCRSTGTSTPCAINRSSIYILLFILISLASLTYDLLHTLKQTPGHAHVQAILNILSTVIPVVLLPVAYAVDTERADVPNAVLNIRQASERPFVVCL